MPLALSTTATMTSQFGTLRIRITDLAPDPGRLDGYVQGDVIGGTDNRFLWGEPVLVPAAALEVDK